MLEQNDLKQIKGIVDSSSEGFAVVVNKGFQEQKEYMDERFDRIDKELSAIRYELSDVRTRLERLEAKVERIIKMETEDFMATTNEINRMKLRIKLMEQKQPVF